MHRLGHDQNVRHTANSVVAKVHALRALAARISPGSAFAPASLFSPLSMIAKRILPCRGFAPSGTQSLPDHGKRHQGRGQGRREQPPDGRIWAQLPEIGIDKGKTHSDASLCQGAPSVLLEAYGGAPRGRVWPSSRRSFRSFVLASLRALHLDLRRHRRQIGSDRGMAGPAPCTGRAARVETAAATGVHTQRGPGRRPPGDGSPGWKIGGAAYTVSGANAGPAARLA